MFRDYSFISPFLSTHVSSSSSFLTPLCPPARSSARRSFRQPNRTKPLCALHSQASKNLSSSVPTSRFSNLLQQLSAAILTGSLGSARPDAPSRHPLYILFATIPVSLLLVQFLYSYLITVLFHPPHSNAFLGLQVSILSSVGWALFILLAFFISEASARYQEPLQAWNKLSHHLQQLVRQLAQVYPPGTWHPGDTDRILAHLAVYPIALKMHLRGEKDSDFLSLFLHEHDVQDVLNSPLGMHIHCMQVVRAYFSAAEDDCLSSFQPAVSKTPAGNGARYFVMDVMDAVDMKASEMCRVARYGPAKGYVNHLRIFLTIWLALLPLCIVSTSGWYTPLVAVLVSYGVGMPYLIARALNEPFGSDLQDIRLNRLAAEASSAVLKVYDSDTLRLSDIIKERPDSSELFTEPDVSSESSSSKTTTSFQHNRFHFLKSLLSAPFVLFLVWITAVVVYSLTRSEQNGSLLMSLLGGWKTYMPFNAAIVGLISLGVFSLLGFWVNDAHGRYRRALDIWLFEMRTKIDTVAFQISVLCRPGLWHNKDRERLFSFLAALPYVVKMQLRETRDTTELEGLLARGDLDDLRRAQNLPRHCLHLVYGYLNSMDSADSQTFRGGSSPLSATIYPLYYNLWAVESMIAECEALKKFPLSVSFTNHLRVFSAFWLALLPLSLIGTGGLFSFICLAPVGYSLLRLLSIGKELSDPFGTDEDDVPMDMLCQEMKTSIQGIFMASRTGPSGYVKSVSPYRRESFHVAHLAPARPEPAGQQPTFKSSVQLILNNFVSVDTWSQVAVIAWSCVAVTASYVLSSVWDSARHSKVRAWSSPIDVSGSILVNVGFALFMTLSFRASNALGRYESGASLMHDLRRNLRNLTSEFIQIFQSNSWHDGDKERVIAHVVQVPLTLRYEMLGRNTRSNEKVEGLLLNDDIEDLQQRSNKLDHILNVIETYVLTMDSKDPKYVAKRSNEQLPVTLTVQIVSRISALRLNIRKALGTKRYPGAASYARHQMLFTRVWLALLPLSMTSSMGFMTILWAPLISYGILGLESISRQLADPFGTDKIDLPIESMCNDMVADILEEVSSAEWSCKNRISESQNDEDSYLKRRLHERTVVAEYNLAHVNNRIEPQKGFNEGAQISLTSPRMFKEKATPYAHFLRSVPWSVLGFIFSASAVGVIFSFIARRAGNVLHWESFVTISGEVPTHVSFAAFTLLSFFVQAAFNRYNSAGRIWGDELRGSCHALAVQWLSLFPEGTWHKGDHDRALSHIAAVPLALKADLRESRDLREIKGLLSQRDLGAARKELLWRPEGAQGGNRVAFFKNELVKLEKMVQQGTFLASFRVSSAFVALLKTMLWIWFALLPFALAETSGWLTLFWIPIIAYGLLGMYAIAAELLQPFGTDLNDLDLDKMGDEIVSDVLFVARNYRREEGYLLGTNVCEVQVPTMQLSSDKNQGKVNSGVAARVRELWSLSWHVMSLRQICVIALWALTCVSSAIFLKQLQHPFAGVSLLRALLSPHPSIKGYISFALFSLLGFQLFDSHGRYSRGQRLWHDGILMYTRLLANRIFHTYSEGTWHKGDLNRIASYLSAIAVTTAASLRGEDCSEKLTSFMAMSDVKAVINSPEQAEHCIDVVRAYLIKGDQMQRETPESHPPGGNEHWMMISYLELLRKQVSECERLVRVPIPFGYIQHSKVFLAIWLTLLPLGFAEMYGWFSIPLVVLLAYGVLGAERWARELSDPFGRDMSDLPLEEFTEDVSKCVQQTLKVFGEGTKSIIKTGRIAFPGV